ncbi:DUF6431 domain-containing protein [Allobaculum mucilyticum]|uniref:DUF6431 domain-containing protein n=1 Tax=Allobaculum mucilyticum TaxID=2834459 RepID=UPI003BF779C2
MQPGLRSFYGWSSCCPDCGHRLYRHDTCNRSVKTQSAQTVVSLTIHRVHCPHCGRTHRVLPLFVIPSFQICSDTAAEIISASQQWKASFQAVQRTG